MRRSLLWSAIGFVALSSAAFAEPARIIILRHAEKLNAHELCAVGAERAQALAKQFLGRGAKHSLFRDGDAPAALIAITLHTIETISPAAQTSVCRSRPTRSPPQDDEPNSKLDQHTREAARDLLGNPNYGRTVIVTLGAKHNAKRNFEKDYPHEQVTLRQLLRLDQVKDVPENWPGREQLRLLLDHRVQAGNPVPSGFRMLRQDFTAPFDHLPANGWDEPEFEARQSRV